MTKSATGVEVNYLHHDGAWRVDPFDCVLAATRRSPALAGLGLEDTGLALDERGVPQFDRFTMQCRDSPRAESPAS